MFGRLRLPLFALMVSILISCGSEGTPKLVCPDESLTRAVPKEWSALHKDAMPVLLTEFNGRDLFAFISSDGTVQYMPEFIEGISIWDEGGEINVRQDETGIVIKRQYLDKTGEVSIGQCLPAMKSR